MAARLAWGAIVFAIVWCAAVSTAGAASLGPIVNQQGFAGNWSSGHHPPDPVVAASPEHVVHMATGTGTAVFDRRTLAPVSGPIGPSTFARRTGNEVLDPQVMWDDTTQRFYFVHNWRAPGSANPRLAGLTVGWTRTSDPSDLTGGWCTVQIDTGTDFEDRPKLGDNDSHLIIGTNTFESDGGDHSKVYTIPKPANGSTSCPSGPPAGMQKFGSETSPLRNSDSDIVWSPVPAPIAGASGTGYVVAADNVAGSRELMVWHVNSSGVLVPKGELTVPEFAAPPRPQQPPPFDTLDSHDRRLTQAVAAPDPGAGGSVGFWTQHTIRDPAGTGRAVVRWYELLPENCTGDPCSGSALRQRGEVKDPVHHVFNAAISPSASGNEAVINYNVSSTTLAPEIRARARQASTPLGAMGPEEITLATSDAPSQDQTCAPIETVRESCRWGDAAAAAPDPADPHAVWGSNQALGPAPTSGEAGRPHWKTHNFSVRASDSPTLALESAGSVDAEPGGDGDDVLEPGESFDVATQLRNSGSATATGVTGTLASQTSGLTLSQSSSPLPSIAPAGTAANTTPFRASLASSASCGVPLRLSITVDTAQGRYKVPVSLATGAAGPASTANSPTGAQAIPDASTTGVSSSITLGGTGTVADVDARVARITHPWVGDLEIELVAPDGTAVTLTSRPGGAGNGGRNLVDTVFDDEASTSLQQSAAPYTGRFLPAARLSAFDGKAVTGTWRMVVRDLAGDDTGTFEGWSLTSSRTQCNVAPTASFEVSPASAPTGTSVTFKSTSGDRDGTVSLAWDLDGDGQFIDGTGETATKSFAEPGTHAVRLRVTDDDGEVRVATRTVTVSNRLPTAEFTASPNPAPTGTPVTFTSSSTDPEDGSTLTHAWDLDNDGGFDDATGPTASHSFGANGVYTVGLQVTDTDGGVRTTSRTVTIDNQGPTAAFSVSQTPVPTDTTVTFTSSSSDPEDGTNVLHAWDTDDDGQFDNGTGPTATRRFVDAGTYEVHLRVTDTDGAQSVATHTVTVENRAPTAAFGTAPASPFTNEPVTFTSTSNDPEDGSGVTHAWDLDNNGEFNDGTAATAARSFADDGTYTVSLRVTDSDGTTDVTTQMVTVRNRPPVAAFSVPSGSVPTGTDVTFTSSSRDSDGSVAALAWELDGDGDFNDATGTTATRSFDRKGTYTVRLRVTDNDGATEVTEQTVTVTNRLPNAAFGASPNPAQTGTPVTFTSTSRDPEDGTALSHEWELDGNGDFNDATGTSASRSYAVKGTYQVRLRVTDGDGGSVTVAHTLTIDNRAPNAEFTVSPDRAPTGTEVAFTSSSSDPEDGTALTHAWDTDDDREFDDGTGRTSSRAFKANGTYIVRLRVTDRDGGVDETERTVIVDNRAPTASFAAPPSPVATGTPVTFKATAIDQDGSIMTWEWDTDDDGAFDDGIESSVTEAFGRSGEYTVRLRVTDDDGVQSIATEFVRVTNRPPTADFGSSPAAPRVGERVTFTSSSSDPEGTGLTHAWDLDGDGDFDDGGSPTAMHVFTTAGPHNVRLRVTDGDATSATTERAITVAAPPEQPRVPSGDEPPGDQPPSGGGGDPRPGGDDPQPGRGGGTDEEPADTRAPRGSLRVRTRAVSSLLKRGLALRFSSSEAASARFLVLVDRRTAARLGLRGTKSGSSIEIGEAVKRGERGRASLRIKLDRRARAQLRRLSATRRLTKLRITVKMRLTDEAGNSRTVTKKSTLGR